MAPKITCLVTLHGIGFQQTPQPEAVNSGYADPLHQHLKTILGKTLSDDPERDRPCPGANGAIYVQSRWRNEQGQASREEGLKRLGTWSEDKRSVQVDDAPLIDGDGFVSHVALVYSDLEPVGPEIGATLMTLGMTLFSVSHYASASRLIHTAFVDGLAIVGHHSEPEDQEPVSSRSRTDLRARSIKQVGHHALVAPTPGLLTMLRDLGDDVACYVCYNEERERIRSFVRDALMRLAHRGDVDTILLNTHSNGTVVAFDVLRHLPEEVACKIKGFVTAGSPLRKYADLFHWGYQVQCTYSFNPWYNFWDQCDPVADPLTPPRSWHLGDRILPAQETLFSRVDLRSEEPCWLAVEDHEIHNVENSRGGGLQAHNYWDNEKEFVPQLADVVCHAINSAPVKAA